MTATAELGARASGGWVADRALAGVRERRGVVAAVGGLTVLAAILRFWGLGAQGFWYDEGNTALLVHFSLGHMLGLIPQTESTPPLYYCVAWVWVRIFGDHEAGLRSLSAVCGVLTVPVMFLAARKLVSERVGVICAALVACDPFLIWYSQEARSYEMLVLLSALALLGFAHAREHPTPRALALWAAASALALATHYYAVVAVVPEALWLLRLWWRRRSVQVAVGVLAVWGAALIPLVLKQNSTGRDSWIGHAPLGERLGQIWPQFVIGTNAPAYHVLEPLAAVTVILGAVLLLAPRAGREETAAGAEGSTAGAEGSAAGAEGLTAGAEEGLAGFDPLYGGKNPPAPASARRRGLLAPDSERRRGRLSPDSERRRGLVALALGAAGFILALLLVAGGSDTLITRNLIPLFLPFLVALAAGFGARRLGSAAGLRRVGVLGLLAAAVWCGVGVAATAGIALNRNLQRPDWRPLARVLGARPAPASGGRVILLQHYQELLPLSLYLPGLAFWRDERPRTVREFDVIALGSPQERLCWWGAACNLIPSKMQPDYPLPGFHEVWVKRLFPVRTGGYQFTVMRLIAARPTPLTRAEVSHILHTTTLRHDELLWQP